ncbi:MAG: iron-containing alcohol dehydrogenase [Solibacillus sp.]
MGNLFLPKEVRLGQNRVDELVEIAEALHMKKAFVLYSKSAVGQRLTTLQAQFTQAVFYGMPKGEPTTTMLQVALQHLMSEQCDGVIAIGGGSVMDLAKALAVLAKMPELTLSEIATTKKVERLPLVAVPTTAGTGSEATMVTVIIDEEKGMKLNPGHPALIPDVVILDAILTANVPKSVTAFTGLDALTHAIEAFVSTNATPLSDFYALEAVRLLTDHIEIVYEEPHNLAAREGMLLGSFYAGIAFSNASTNLAHATGRALGTKFHLPHGQSVALMHPFVVEYSMESCRERYDEIAEQIGLEQGEQLILYLQGLNDQFGVWQSAKNVVDQLTVETIKDMTKSALNGNGILTNRQVPTAQQIEQLFIQLRKRLQHKGDFAWYN